VWQKFCDLIDMPADIHITATAVDVSFDLRAHLLISLTSRFIMEQPVRVLWWNGLSYVGRCTLVQKTRLPLRLEEVADTTSRAFQQDGRAASECAEGSAAGRCTGYRTASAIARAALLVALSSALIGATTLCAQTEPPDDPLPAVSSAEIFHVVDSARSVDESPAEPPAADAAQSDRWLNSWLRRVAEARALQPHTAAPLVTTHNDLVQQFRYDGYVQQDPNNTRTTNAGTGRGVEIIPTTRLEVAFAMPPYLTHQSSVPDGFGDWSFLLKFRVFSAPEGKGAYFVGFVLNAAFPTGSTANSADQSVWSPAVAFGKGWGNFNVQNTLGGTLPQTGAEVLGRTIVLNDVAQYRIKRVIWPMLEANSTLWCGRHDPGKKQVFLAPGIVFGSFRITGRLRIAVGAGEQIAVTRFHTYNHRYILSLRLPLG
jgi:hypothetical protein